MRAWPCPQRSEVIGGLDDKGEQGDGDKDDKGNDGVSLDSPWCPPLLPLTFCDVAATEDNARIAIPEDGTESPTLFLAVRRNTSVSPGRTRILVGFGVFTVCGDSSSILSVDE